MKLGDFSKLAKHYHNRPEYSRQMVEYILKIAGYNESKDFSIVDIGAGTGKMTKALHLVAPKAKILAVEPNDEMRSEGQKALDFITFLKGSGEETGLDENTADFVCMADSFHWPDHTKALPEFKRILKPNGYFCAIWRSRDIAKNELATDIEKSIKEMIPNLKRVSSGLQDAKDWQSIIESTGDFKNCVFLQMPYLEMMSKERYMGIWHSVNDIQAQAISHGSKKLWDEILNMIEGKISHLEQIPNYYIIRAFVAKSTKE